MTLLSLQMAAVGGFTENFDASTSVPAGWINGGTVNDTVVGHPLSSPNCRAMGAGDTLQTPLVDYPTNLSFYVDSSGGGNGKTATVDYSIDGGGWIPFGSFVVSKNGGMEDYALTSAPNLSASESVRFRFNASFSTWYLDDVVLQTSDVVPTNSPPFLQLTPVETNWTVLVGETVNVMVSVTEPDGDEISLTGINLPEESLFASNPLTGFSPLSQSFTWTPSSTGLTHMTFSAVDKDGASEIDLHVLAYVPDPSVLLFENFDASTVIPAGWVDVGTLNDAMPSHCQSVPNCRAMGISDTLDTPAVDYPTNLSFYVDASDGGNGQVAWVMARAGTNEWTTVGSFVVTLTGETVSFPLEELPGISTNAGVSFQFISYFATWYLDDVLIQGGLPTRQPPELAPIGNQVATVSNTLEFGVSAADVDNDLITLWGESVPSGARFNSVSHVGSVSNAFLFTPAPEQVGLVFTSTFFAADMDGTNQETVTIAVYEHLAGFSRAGITTNEDPGVWSVDIQLDTSLDATVRVAVAGTAIQGEDYSLSGTEFVFVAGESTTQTLTLTLDDDDLPEADETIHLLIEPPAFAGAGPIAELTLTILDDDVIFEEMLDANPDWTTSWEWAFGIPIGLGGSTGAPDPLYGHTGNYVYGYNLYGDYYSPMVTPYYLTAPVMDCSGLRSIQLSFWRWMGIEESIYDEASIQVSNDGKLWQDVWVHAGPALSDGMWKLMEYDLSAIAEDQETVYIRWGMGPTDAYVQYCGWNIDDIVVDGIAITEPLVKFDREQFAVHETAGTARFTVLRRGPTNEEVRVDYATSNGTATAGSDYTATTGTLVFAAGVVSNFFEVPISSDEVTEGSETLFVHLGELSTNALPGGIQTTTLTITDDNLPQASFPFFDGFESGVFSNYWQNHTTLPGGRIRLSSTLPPTFEGANHACMDSVSTYTFGYSEMVLNIDLSGKENVYLDFWERILDGYLSPMPEHFTGRVEADGVAISADGVNWYRLYNIFSYPYFYGETNYLHQIHNLSEIADSYGLPLGPHFKVKFQHHGLYSYPAGGSCLDNILLYDGSTTADLAVQMDEYPDPCTVGSNVTYTLWVTNAGPASATGVTLTNGIPLLATFVSATSSVGTCIADAGAVSWSIGDLLPGAFVEMVLEVSPTDYGVLTNQAMVYSSAFDPLTTNNLTSVTTLVDPPGGDLQFAAAGYAIRENQPAIQLTVTRTNRIFGEITVDYATGDGTAEAGSDYVGTNGTLTLLSGELSNSFWVAILNDSEAEEGETMVLSLSNPTGGAVLSSPSQTVVTLWDDDGCAPFPLTETFESGALTNYWSTYSTGLGRMEITSAYAPCEGSLHLAMDTLSGSALNELVLTIDLAGQEAVTLSFLQKEFGDEDHVMPATFASHYNADGVAMSADGTNWFKVQGLIAADGSGSSCQLFEIPLDILLASTGLSYNDRFKIKFQQYDNVSFTSDGFVFDDIRVFSAKGSLQFSCSAYEVGEFSGAVTVGVERVGGTLGEVSVDYATADGSATAGADYTPVTGTLTFVSGEVEGSFVISLVDDSDDEPAEILHLLLSNPGGGATLASPSNAVLTLRDDDGPGEFVFHSEAFTCTESNAWAAITVLRTDGAEGEASVQYATADGTASNGLDYMEAFGTLLFADGVASQQFFVALLNDSELEETETLFLSLDTPTGGAILGEPGYALLSILDDEDPNYDYYVSAYGQTGAELKQALHEIIDDHTIFSYTPGLWTILQQTDECPTNSTEVLLTYSQIGRDKYQNGADYGEWNREHVWPQSHGFPDGPATSIPPSVDAHNIKPTDVAVNYVRGNKDFDVGGSHIGGTPPTCFTTDTTFEPPDETKGDVARILFYMDVRYAGDQDNEPDLELVDSADTAGAQMGKLSTLIQWNIQDPPDEFEKRRNQLIYENWQGNRNPFIDHPEWALEIWEYNVSIATLDGLHGFITPTNPQVPYASSQLFGLVPDPYFHVADIKTNGVSHVADYGLAAYSFVWSDITTTGTLEVVFSANLAPNGTPEWWLVEQGFTNNFDIAELGDPDGDGYPTWKEYRAGSIPTNAASLLQFEVVDSASVENGIVICWQSASNRTYSIWKGSNLLADFTQCLASNLPAHPPMNTHTDTVDGLRHQFYRIDVEP